MLYHEDEPGNWGQMVGSASIEVGSVSLKMRDGCPLFLRFWDTASSDILLLLHGLGGHGGWYIALADSLAQSGICVYTVDHRGFGRSGGLPGHVDRYQEYVEDVAEVVGEIKKRYPHARIHLLGHSMGGILAAHFAASRHRELLSSVIFLNPWVRDFTRLSVSVTCSLVAEGMMKSRRVWRVTGGSDAMTTNPEALTMLSHDPYWCRQQTATFLWQIFLMRKALFQKARQITCPALVLQAEHDHVVVPTATREFYEALASPGKVWISYSYYSHDAQLEADRTLLENDLVSWIQKHPSTRGVFS